MTATPALTTDLKAQVKLLADDLRQRLEDNSALLADWKRTHHEAQTKERTAMSWVEWREDRIDQAAVAWVLTTVFIRFCEDNSLVKPVWFTGPGRRQEALDGYNAYFRANPEHSDREWLESANAYLQSLPATKALVDAHSALEYVSPSGDASGKLREFWLRRSDDGSLIHDLHDESLSTRFLGDLYQDLSEYAQETYALRQTPVFVEEFILDQTLEPALAERTIEGFRIIDPTCGSGHFLLGAFARLLDRWYKYAPGMEVQARTQKALDAIYGVDLNPFAIAIAQFRLTVAALAACGLRALEDAPDFMFHLAVGDSLIHGPDSNVIPGLGARSAFMPFHYNTEDASLLLKILEEGRYDVVVGNPPYITVKDKSLNKMYRSKFKELCKGAYALTVPFVAQFFALAKNGENSGWVGLIASKSFMKREFGAPLIENYLTGIDLRLVVDSEGAWIPGHNSEGTPTVILAGKNQPPISDRVHCVLGKGKRETRASGENGGGPYWSMMVSHLNDSYWDDDWMTITDLSRTLLSHHPWSLTGGDSGINLLAAIGSASIQTLSDLNVIIGRTTHTGSDECFYRPRHAMSTQGLLSETVPVVMGGDVRNYILSAPTLTLFPYEKDGQPRNPSDRFLKQLWPLRTTLENRIDYGQTPEERGLRWFDHSMFFPKRFRVPLSLSFAEVSSHNHFVLDYGGKVFKQTAPAIILPDGTSENRYLELLGILNSSIACFWLKQNSQPKGGAAKIAWLRTYQVSATTVKDFPLPRSFPLEIARQLNTLALELKSYEPEIVCLEGKPTLESLESAKRSSDGLRAQMIALQEELDWKTYYLYGLLDSDLTSDVGNLPRLNFGERAFEITLAADTSDAQQAWFSENHAEPLTGFPSTWSDQYTQLVRRRLEVIAKNPHIQLLETPEYKRRWEQEAWQIRQEGALKNWLLDRLEEHRFWFDSQGRPSPMSVAQLSDHVYRDPDMVSVLALWENRPDIPVVDSLKRLLGDEVVPFQSGYRYKESGLRKRVAWEETWAKQRSQDHGEKVDIQVPPKYSSADFQASYARLRGDMDVPQERFILYPDASRDGDGTPLLGWAGWDHAEQALALASVIHDREQEGWPDERLVSLIAGLAELQPWVDQWHGEVHPLYGVSLAAFCAEELARRAAQVSMTIEELRWWRPEKKRGRGRGKA